MAQDTQETGKAPVVRFAPSPTGFLHIGGARTALFNWLYAKSKGGTFLLRIEDTDRARNSPEAIKAILDGLSWLELDWDGEAVSQFGRGNRHREVAQSLLEAGHAYKCFLSQEDLQAMREKADAERRPLIVRSPWRERDPSEAPDGAPYVIRLKSPREGETVIDDHVQGKVTFANKELDDLIILRSDSTPTYNLAVVVDDHDMGVTHVIRGVDHLTNAARQTLLYDALGWRVPQWAHVPLIHGPDGAKLSKRHGALGVEAYRAKGYLPEAMRNYLVRLGWSHGDDEIISTPQLIEWFELSGIGKSPARFDFKKLEALNGHYMRTSDNDALVQALESFLDHVEGGQAIKKKLASGAREKLLAAMPGLKERAKTLDELKTNAEFIFSERPLDLDDKAKKLLNENAKEHLVKVKQQLEKIEDWDTEVLENEVRKYAEQSDLKLGKIAQPLRAALTGTTVSPPVFDVMVVLGREESIARINDQI